MTSIKEHIETHLLTLVEIALFIQNKSYKILTSEQPGPTALA